MVNCYMGHLLTPFSWSWVCSLAAYLSCVLSVGQEDLKSLHSELHLVSDEWFSIGVQLQVPIGTLRCIRSDIHTVADCLLEMLTVWLKQINPPPTWNNLIKALESPPVGEGLLAQQLRDKYCPSTEEGTPDGSPTFGKTFRPSAPQGS